MGSVLWIAAVVLAIIGVIQLLQGQIIRDGSVGLRTLPLRLTPARP